MMSSLSNLEFLNGIDPKETSYEEIPLLNGRTFERYTTPLIGSDGNTIGRIWYFRDISDNKRLEEKLSRSNARFRALTQHSMDVIGITDASGVVIYRSPSMKAVLGYEPEEMLGKGTFEYFHPEDQLRAHQEFESLLTRPNATCRSEYRIRHKDGTWRHIENTMANYLSDPAIQGVVFNYRDVGERKRASEELRSLTSRILNLRDEESRRIARELHDSTTQKLAALKINLSLLRSLMIETNSSGERMLNECVELAHECTQEIRTISYLLHPPLLDELGLWDAIREYADGFAERSGIRVDLELPQDTARLPKEVELAFFRILQESLSNIHRHSGSSTASIQLTADRNQLSMEIRDTGCGIPDRPAPGNCTRAGIKAGVGISSMRERLRQLGGNLEIDSSPCGTTIRAKVSLGECMTRK